MRRFMALLSAGILVASLAASTVSAAPAASRNSFVGNFQAISDGVVVGRVIARLFEPSQQRLVPGNYDFYGAPGWPVRESHAQLGNVQFWYDPNASGPGIGGKVAYAEGVMCDYTEPNVPNCHEIYLTFVDMDDPSLRGDYLDWITHVVGPGDPWDGTSWAVGNGAFVLTYTGD